MARLYNRKIPSFCGGIILYPSRLSLFFYFTNNFSYFTTDPLRISLTM